MLDVIRLIQDYKIPFKGATTGSQVKVDCPFCQGHFKLWLVVQPFHDNNGYLKNPGAGVCYKCRWNTKDEEVLVRTLTGKKGRAGLIEWKKYQYIPEENGNSLADYVTQQFASSPWAGVCRGSGGTGKTGPLEWPEGYVPLTDPRAILEYRYALNVRGIRHEDIVHYQLGACIEGEYRGYLILPAMSRGKLMFWQGREARGRTNRIRYRTPRGYSGTGALFNIDYASTYNETILCEGWLSSYKTGYDASATFGNKISVQQIELLQSRGVRNIVICHDPDSWKIPEKVRKRSRYAKPPLYNTILRCLGRFDSVRVARLVQGDPDDLGSDLVRLRINAAQGVSSENDVVRLWL